MDCRAWECKYQGRWANKVDVEVVFMPAREGEVSTSHFWETVIHKVDGYNLEILRWLAFNVSKISRFDVMALETSA